MELHPGPEKRRLTEVRRTASDPHQWAFHENEDWYQDLVEHSQDLLCIHDLEGRLLSVNPAPARLLGYSVEEILQIPMRELIAPEFRPEFDAYLRQIERCGESHGYMEVLTKTGERRIWEYHNTLRTEGVARPIVRGIAHDITEQRETEKLLRELSDRLLSKVRDGERTIRELQLFRALLDQCNDAVEVVDPETSRFIDVNQKACSELGYSREELLGMTVFEINPAADEESVAKTREELMASGSVVMDSLHRRKDGTTFPVEMSMKLVRLDRVYVIVIVHNLAERKQTEARLQASESRYRALHDRAPVGICRVETSSHRFLEVNPRFCEIVGRTEPEMLGSDIQSITHPDDLQKTLEKLHQLATGESRHYTIENRYMRPDGSVRWVEAEIVAMWPKEVSPTWHMAIVQDITERGLAEEALQTSERRQHKIAKQLEAERARLIEAQAVAKVGSWEAELPGLEITWSEETHRIFETDPSHFHPRRADFVEFIHPEDRAKVDAAFQASVEMGAPSNVEYRIVMADGRQKVLEEQWRVFHDEQGRPIRLVGTCRDVTEQKRAEVRLREYEKVVESAEDVIVVVDRDYRYVAANRALLRYQGVEESQIIGRRMDEVVGKETFETVIQPRMVECFQGRTVRYEMEFEYPGLGKREFLVSYSPIEGPAGIDRIACVMQDITGRKQAEEALRRSEENYRMFVSKSSEGIFREELETPVSIELPEEELIRHILYDAYIAEGNDALAAMYGFTSGEQLRGKRWREMVPPEDPQNIDLARQFVRSGFRVTDHESREVDIHGNPKVFLNSIIGTVENGRLVRTWGVQRDITEKVKAEEARGKAEEALRQNVAQLKAVTEELRVAQEKLAEEKLYLEETIDTELGFGEIIGRSDALKEVMQKVARVAPSDATVLLLGETGTGKEVVARALHRLSKRHGNSFIKMNCAAIPSGLLESELFGHEKGAFTGAVARKLGRLELADQGTLFLDEIGEIPVSLQPKLLRVLQDREFERLGGTQTLKVNFRLLAATNRDLLQSVKAREFRSDLFYRLNVFPILIPPLRDRREDIRPLVEHFVRKCALQMKKSITSIPSKTMEMLVRWDWPGNIRELENFVERSVILSPGSVLLAPLSELQKVVDEADKNETLRDKERERILQALRDCHGRLGGPEGAAARLGLKRTTLQSKLDHLGIKPGAYRA